MARKLWLASVLGLALVLASGLRAPAFAQSAADPGAVAQARAQLDASEAAYTRAASGSDEGGFSGQLQSLASAGNGQQASQLVAARAQARTSLESAISGYLGALKTQYDAALAAGKNDDAQAILGVVDGLRSRLQQLASDAANEKLAAQGFGAKTANPSVGYGQVARTPAAQPASTTPAPAASATPATPVASGPSYGGDVPASAETKPAPAAAKPRKATGRLVVIARGERPEITAERLERACLLLRTGKAEDEVTTGETELYLIERWRERTPVRIRLAKDEAHVSELARLRLSAGATCSIEGIPGTLAPATRTQGETVELHDWKVLALSSVDRLGAPTTVSGSARPLAASAPAPAAKAPSSKPAPLAPTPLAKSGAAEEENFND